MAAKRFVVTVKIMTELTAENFSDFIEKAEKPVVVDFWASWCSVCLGIADDYENIANELADKAFFCKFNVDEDEDLALSFGISFIPSFIIFENGEVKAKRTSETEPSRLKKFIEQNI